MPVALAPICRNVPDTLRYVPRHREVSIVLSMDNTRELQPVTSDRELFAEAIYSSAADLFTKIDLAKLQT